MRLEKAEKRLILACLTASAVVAAGSVIIGGWMPRFLLGLLGGTAVMLLNFHLLRIAAERYLTKGDYGMAGGIYLLRLVLYALAALGCSRGGALCLYGFVAGVLGLLVGIPVGFGKGRDSR